MQAGDSGRENAIQLLGKRTLKIACPQARFNVRDRNTAVESGQRSAQCGCGVALHYCQVGFRFNQRLFQCFHDACRGLKQSLPRLHHVQVVIRSYPEDRQYLIQHAAVLRRYADLGSIRLRKRPEVQKQWTQLDGFRPRSENKKDGPSQVFTIVTQTLRLLLWLPRHIEQCQQPASRRQPSQE